MLSLALACGGLAASQVRGAERELEAQVGGLVPVLVARDVIPAGTRITSGRAARLFGVRQVPQRFAPPDALIAPEEAAGRRTAAALGAGTYVTAGALGGDAETAQSGPALRAGERALDLAVSAGEGLSGLGGRGARVDVLVTTEGRSGAGRTFVALENAELLATRPGEAGAVGGGAGAEAVGPVTIATLRVTQRQAVYLTAAQSFAREIRLLARPPGDRRRGGSLPVGAGEL